MKKHLHKSLRALFLSMAVLLSLPMLAVEVEIGGINYDLDAEAKQATVIEKSSGKYSGSIVIPESVEHEGNAYSVTSIGGWAFNECSGLTSVIIPNSVTSIGASAFDGCFGLTSVTIPNSVTSIETSAFYGCSGLTSITIGNSVTSIGISAFSYCTGLTSVTIGNSVTSIRASAFDGCSGLTSVTIPNSVTSIESYAFSGCSGLTSITISNSVENIWYEAFANCSKLHDVYCHAENVPSTQYNAFEDSPLQNATLHVPGASVDSYKATEPWSGFRNIVAISTEVDGINYDFDADKKQATVIEKSSGKYSGEVVIPESVEHEGNAYSVTSIGDFAFWFCDGLTSVTIPNSVTSIGEYAFAFCSGLSSVTIPNSVTSIGNSAFYECSGLTSVTIPNSVKSIGQSAFSGCDGLTSVTIGNSVESIGYNAFYRCSFLTSVHISDIAAWCNIDFGGSYSNPLSFAVFLYLNGEEVKDLVIPNSVTSIRNYAFFGCSGLASVTIPNSVTSIGNWAFYHCPGLTSVTIPNSVTSIGEGAFWYCYGLTSVTIPNSVTSIGSNAFANCYELLDVYCYAENVPSTQSNAFEGSYPENATLHVPAASINNYKATAPWSGFGSIVALPGQYSLTVSSVGYATLYLDFNAEIPEGVEAYVAKEVVDSRLKMELVEGVLPANTGVIIIAEEGTYAFVESNETPAVIEENLLKGTVEKTEITAEANTSYYVLSAPDGVVAMYLALLTDNKFWNNANKAYLPINYGDLGIFNDEVDSSVEQLSRRLVFDFDDETGIDELKGENGKVKTAIFDLSGRRVQKGQKGIFIRDGKVVVK